MTVKLSFTSEKDLENKPATFLMLSSFPDAGASFGLGANRRTFSFSDDLLTALEPAKLGDAFLQHLRFELEKGRSVTTDLSDVQAAAINMLPNRNGFRWVWVEITKIAVGDGSSRFTVTYRQGTREISGSGLETIENLEAHVREFVALDWQAIRRSLQSEENWNGVFSLPVETAQYIFDGAK